MKDKSHTKKWSKMILGLAGAVAGAVAAYILWIRPRILRWGATDEEVNRPLPGDALLPTAQMEETHAITIHAPASRVWPWLVQIGHQRAGWYSYDAIHRMMGIAGSVDYEDRSTDRIVPELQDLSVGDTIEIAPDAGVEVALLEPERAMVLYAGLDMRTAEPVEANAERPETFLLTSWAWVLDPIDEETTRLIVRIRQEYNPSLPNELMIRGIIEPGSFIMERRTMLNIKQLAEGAYR
jgi:hypothetical protein